jgi:hypothetical protein
MIIQPDDDPFFLGSMIFPIHYGKYIHSETSDNEEAIMENEALDCAL